MIDFIDLLRRNLTQYNNIYIYTSTLRPSGLEIFRHTSSTGDQWARSDSLRRAPRECRSFRPSSAPASVGSVAPEAPEATSSENSTRPLGDDPCGRGGEGPGSQR